jgi:ketosteroid isomerase-like protein
MSEQNKELVRRFYEEVENGGKLELIDELIAPDFRDVYNLASPFPVKGRDGMRQLVTTLRSFGFHLTIEELLAEGDKVVCRMSSDRTAKSPSGEDVKLQLVEILRVANGMLSERWVIIDQPRNRN